MKTVEKFESFEELKATEKEAEDYELSLKKHKEYKKFFMRIRALIVRKEKNSDFK